MHFLRRSVRRFMRMTVAVSFVFCACSTDTQQASRRFKGNADKDGKSSIGTGDGTAVGKSTGKDENPLQSDKLDADEATKTASVSDDIQLEGEAKVPEVKKPVRALTELDAIAGIPTGADQMKIICQRQSGDAVRTTFCGQYPPVIKSLIDLQTALGLAQQNNPQFAFSGHSSSLVAEHVTSINPRAIIFTPNTGNNTPLSPYVAMGFARGEQFVEIAANDPNEQNLAKRLKFFLVKFEQGCNKSEGGCTVGELLAPTVEQNWTGFTVYEDEDLKNTLFDCRHCHQPGGVTAPKMLRMQELRNPWTHFFRNNTNGGQQLLADYQAAHGTTEAYAGIPGNRISRSDPADLEDLVRAAGFGNQPNEFDTRQIESNNNLNSWQQIYDVFASGRAIAVPYFQVSISDPTKLAAMTASYQKFISNDITAKELPDIRDTVKDSDRWAMGFAVKPGSTGQQILMQACSQCHNSTLDQELSRAKFNVDLTKVSKEEAEVAAQRIMLPANDPSRMPPARFRSLNDQEKASLIQFLRDNSK